GLHLVGVGDVGALERGRRRELGGERLARIGVDVGDDDAGPFLHEPLDDAATEPAPAAGDDRDLAGQLGRHHSDSSIQNSGTVSTPWRSKIASISARSASLIDQPTAPALSSTSATVRQPTSAVLTAGCEIAQRSASCGRLLSYLAAMPFSSSTARTLSLNFSGPNSAANILMAPMLPWRARQSALPKSSSSVNVPVSNPNASDPHAMKPTP